MKVQNLQYQSIQRESFLSQSFDFAKNLILNKAEFEGNFALGVFEIATGIEFTTPTAKAGTYGRILGRYTAKLFGDVMTVLGLIMTTSGTFSEEAALVLSGVGLAPAGIAIETAKPVLIAGGIAVAGAGYAMHRNYDKLNKLQVSKNTNISINQADKLIKKGKAPKTIDRIDKAKIIYEKDHIHFKEDFSINRDGSFKHKPNKIRKLTNKEKFFFKQINFTIPEEML